MTRRTLQIAIAVIAAQIAPQIALADETCEIRGEQDNFYKCIFNSCSTSERTRSVKFPDGREIWVVAHNHGAREWPRKFNESISQAPISQGNFNNLLDHLINDTKIAAANAEEDLPFLRRFLRVQSDKVFVGIETYDENVPPFLDHFSYSQKKLLGLRSELHPESLAKAQKALLTIYGPHIYLRITEPEHFNNAYLKGFELAEAGTYEGNVDAERSRAFESLKRNLALAGDRELLDLVAETRGQLVLLNETYEPEKHDQLILNMVRTHKKIPNDWRPAILQWVQLELSALKARLFRDVYTVRQMVNEKRSGVLFVGNLHLSAIARLLKEECQRIRGDSHRPSPRPYTGNTYYGVSTSSATR